MQGQMDVRATAESVWLKGVEARSAFIVRAYVHLLIAILAFVGIEVAIFATGAAEGISQWLMTMPGGWLMVLGGFMLVSWIATRVAHTAESLPAQYGALACYVLAQAIIFVPMLYIANRFYPGVLLTAGAATGVAFGGLTAIAVVSRRDFSFFRGLLIWGGFGAMLAILAGIVFGFTLGPMFSIAIIVLAGAAILHDTSNILLHYPEDRYVGAALQLFASIALMLWYMLRLAMSLRD